MEFIQLVCITDQEIDRTAFGIGCSFLQEHLHSAQVHACECRRIAPGKGQLETQFLRIELNRSNNIVDCKTGMGLLAFDEWNRRICHPSSLPLMRTFFICRPFTLLRSRSEARLEKAQALPSKISNSSSRLHDIACGNIQGNGWRKGY